MGQQIFEDFNSFNFEEVIKTNDNDLKKIRENILGTIFINFDNEEFNISSFLEFLSKKNREDIFNENFFGPLLMLSISIGKLDNVYEFVKAYVNYRFNFETPNELDGATALHFLFYQENVPNRENTYKMLMDIEGIDVNALDSEGFTPLMYFFCSPASHKNVGNYKDLISKSNFGIVNNENKTVFDYIKDHKNYYEIIEIFGKN